MNFKSNEININLIWLKVFMEIFLKCFWLGNLKVKIAPQEYCPVGIGPQRNTPLVGVKTRFFGSREEYEVVDFFVFPIYG